VDDSSNIGAKWDISHPEGVVEKDKGGSVREAVTFRLGTCLKQNRYIKKPKNKKRSIVICGPGGDFRG